MDINTSDRARRPPGRARPPGPGRGARSSWPALGVGSAWVAAREPVEDLRYGQFKQKLVQGRGPVRPGRPDRDHRRTGRPRPTAGPVRFRTSRLGIERDEELSKLLEAHVPDGNYDAAPDHSTAQSLITCR